MYCYLLVSGLPVRRRFEAHRATALYGAQANLPIHAFEVGKWGAATAGKAKAGSYGDCFPSNDRNVLRLEVGEQVTVWSLVGTCH